ncbi:MAG TPA: ergothioneine biosynthesis protein EgtB, partial [Steroidobacteraceae bacterium]|nr:ergothioneine biosynthesis protein EgtB [Steroidobacteraceae bacterium]
MYVPRYRFHDLRYRHLFNSYYQSIGSMYPRADRGLLTRPTVAETYRYRAHVDSHVAALLAVQGDDPTLAARVTLGLHHEQQHQELLLTDVKHAFALNPLRPAYRANAPRASDCADPLVFRACRGGLREVGHAGGGFCFDNELPRHRAFVPPYRLATRLVTNGEYRDFVRDGGYEHATVWLADGWEAVQREGWQRPLYWSASLDQEFTLSGLIELDPRATVCHLSFYEADAFARWAGARLPGEVEWELAAAELPVAGNFLENAILHPVGHRSDAVVREPPDEPGDADDAGASQVLDFHGERTAKPALSQMFGDAWEWTSSPYGPYPGYRPAAGALGEYNGKFMVNRIVLRGGSCATPRSHIRATYRNFFAPAARWQFAGVRLAQDSR